MTVLMTVIGIPLFIVSTFTQPLKVAFKRLWMMIGTGFLIDISIITLAMLSGLVAIH